MGVRVDVVGVNLGLLLLVVLVGGIFLESSLLNVRVFVLILG